MTCQRIVTQTALGAAPSTYVPVRPLSAYLFIGSRHHVVFHAPLTAVAAGYGGGGGGHYPERYEQHGDARATDHPRDRPFGRGMHPTCAI
jgi:hypothetical protein